MVTRHGKSLGTRRAIPVAIISVTLVLSCSFFAANPFPEYIAGMERKIDIGDRIASVLGSATSARYEIDDVVVGGNDKILVLVAPSVAEPTADSPTPKLLVFSRTLDYLGTVTPQAPLGYVSRPFALDANNKILAGVTVFDPTTFAVSLTLPTTGLSGFAFATPLTNTYILSEPAGQNSSFSLTLRAYDNLWTAPTDYTANVVSTSIPNDPGYKLEGARFVFPDTITATLRKVTDDQLYTVNASLAGIIAATAPALLEGATPTRIDGKDAYVYYTDNDIIIRRASGVFERYSPDGARLTSSITVESGSDVGIVYGFSRDGAYLYRLNPVSGSFSLIRTWW